MTVRWIAHRGLASGRPGGTPTRQTIQRAIDINADMVEVDVHMTADGVLVVRHDAGVRRGRSISRLTYRELLLADAVVMTVAELDTFVAGRLPILLDIKARAAVEPLATWLAAHPQPQRHVVCTPNLTDLQRFRAIAPTTRRWATFPDVDGDARTAFERILAALAHRRREGEVNQMVRDLIRAARDVVRDRSAAASTIGGMPWRDGLPRELAGVQAATGASGISIHQWLVTPALVDAAHDLGMTVTAWTVNRADALAAVTRAGVDYVTSDDPEGMQRILPIAGKMYPPPPGIRSTPPLIEPPSRDIA